MNFFTRRKILKAVNSLDLIPVRICDYKEVDGKVVVLVPKFPGKWMHALFPVSRLMFFHVRLDNSGSSVWKNISGNNNVSELSRLVLNEAAEKSGSADEFQQRVSKFISMLYDRRCISFRQLSVN